MKDASRPISLGLFALVLLCFLLPFARISCDKQVVVQANGYEVAFGKEIPAQPDSTGGKKTWQGEPARPDFVAIVFLVATLAGIGLARVKGRRGAIIRATYSGHCLLLPLALWFDLSIRTRGDLEMLAGFWATFVLFAAACVVNLLYIRRLRSEPAGCG
ncbi:hypothetical protein FJY68_04555 [candidate division WOR-3 bacterium]|uniref:Uncharacterized protein n=1 Tax=candidate division WOR-3 bacterium TaxID=2052148 RepID=A0A938BSV3_UNCW3|nr:hypothetical protein [candidate division WOR-3 bacterium]